VVDEVIDQAPNKKTEVAKNKHQDSINEDSVQEDIIEEFYD